MPSQDEDLIRQAQERLRQFMSSGSPRGGLILALLALAGLAVWTTVYTVPSDSVAVVQRFGRYIKDVPPGLHLKLPFVDTVNRFDKRWLARTQAGRGG